MHLWTLVSFVGKYKEVILSPKIASIAALCLLAEQQTFVMTIIPFAACGQTCPYMAARPVWEMKAELVFPEFSRNNCFHATKELHLLPQQVCRTYPYILSTCMLVVHLEPTLEDETKADVFVHYSHAEVVESYNGSA